MAWHGDLYVYTKHSGERWAGSSVGCVSVGVFRTIIELIQKRKNGRCIGRKKGVGGVKI